MTEAQKKLRKDLLAKIHLNPKHKEIKGNGAWSDWLEYRFGVDSSKELSIKELYSIIDLLNDRLDDVNKPMFYADKHSRKNVESYLRREKLQHQNSITQAQMNYIGGRFKQLGFNEHEQRDFIKRQTNKMYLHFESMTKEEATKTIIGLDKLCMEKALHDMY